jgi:hypothetical protein
MKCAGLMAGLLVAGGVVLAAPPGAEKAEMQEVDVAQVDRALLTPRASRLVDAPEFKWRHAQTEHFVVHYENGIFAAKVARLAEFFYDFISADLQGAQDRVSGRSHLFIFRNEKDWQTFQQKLHGGRSWSGPSPWWRGRSCICSRRTACPPVPRCWGMK